jgi:hypothetical protein
LKILKFAPDVIGPFFTVEEVVSQAVYDDEKSRENFSRIVRLPANDLLYEALMGLLLLNHL